MSHRTYRTADFDYQIPHAAVAQQPLPERSGSRLLVLARQNGRIRHRRFADFPDLTRRPDVLVVNASRVIPARLQATRRNGSRAELLLVQPEPNGTWLAMVRPGSKLRPGQSVRIGDDGLVEIGESVAGGLRRVRAVGPLDITSVMHRYGTVPLPPYIERPADETDEYRYQTIFARVDGSVAAPTAGLHFTPEVIDQVRQRGVKIARVILHVGPGTFRPVTDEDPSGHSMHREWFRVDPGAADTINAARDQGGRIWAVGTTTVRVLETATEDGRIRAGDGWTDLFIHPPYRFRAVDALLTNFHLPRSTLLMLVAAFGGHQATMGAYRAAIDEKYRFYSYGDAMAVV